MRQGLFEVFGDGQLGLKVDDLNLYASIISECRMEIPTGFAIATGVFDQLVKKFDLNGSLQPEEIEKYGCPDFLLSINERILDKLEMGIPYAIRSSALSEQGGTGIYSSVFFQRTSDRKSDLQKIWHCESVVYAGEFTQDAKLWREKNNASLGMAILIQPVIGFRFDDCFLPALSGVAYTSYNGLPTVRVVIGLGTRAVNGGGIIYNCPSNSLLHFQREMWEQESADIITPAGDVGQTRTQYEKIYGEIARGFESFNGIFEILPQLQKHGNFYLEWIIDGSRMYIVQCATYEDKLPGNCSFDSSSFFLLLRGGDVLHSGRATCKSVVYVHEWMPEISQVLEYLNGTIKDYLLIVPQDALSLLAGIDHPGHRLAFRHFSNALAVVEKQRTYTEQQLSMMVHMNERRADHSSGVGATHFSQLCSRTNILFIGGEFDPTPLFVLPGGMDYRGDIGITIWDTTAEVVVDAGKMEGYAYISKQSKKIEYSSYQVQDWSFALRSAANSISGSDNQDIANHFYIIHYAIAPSNNPVEFDPFKLDEIAIVDFGGVAGIIGSLKDVIANGGQFVNGNIWNGGLKKYLEELLLHLMQ